MKKLFFTRGFTRKNSGSNQIFRIMRLTTCFLFLFTCFAFAESVNSQNARVNLNKHQAELKDVLDEIESQTDYLFISNRDINLRQHLSVKAKNKPVREVLSNLCEKANLSFTMEGVNIILSKNEKPAIQAAPQQQTHTMTGVVTDHTGESLVGVNVVEKGVINGTVTDINGTYSIPLSGKKAILIFSYIGYLTQEIKVDNQKTIHVTLKEDMMNLEEVVVIGYGSAKKKDLTGAIANIKTEKLEKEAPRSLQELLRANAAGLTIGMPTTAKGNASMQLRGKGTLKAGASPLIVLDGVIFEGDVSDVNPIDISSVDILKDASSAAVYGAKAANGVVVITTKKGRPIGKPVLTFNANVGFVQSVNAEKALNEPGFIKYRQDYNIGRNTDEYHAKYPQMYNDPNKLNGVNQLDWYNYDQKVPVASVTPEELTRAWLSRLNFTSPEIQNYTNGISTDWSDKVFQAGLQQDYSVSISNKTDDMSYYWSMGYADREGIITGERFTTFRTRLNLESKITNFLTVGLNSSFSSRNEGFLACDWSQLTQLSPFTTDNRNDPESSYQRLPSGINLVVNPFYDNQFIDRKDLYHNFNTNVYAQVKLPFGIEYQMNFTPYYQWREYYNHQSSENELWAESGGNSTRTNKKVFNWQMDNIVRWNKTFNKKHRTEVTLLANAEKGQSW